jgi:hypothetical protein
VSNLAEGPVYAFARRASCEDPVGERPRCQTMMPGHVDSTGDSFRDRASGVMAADRNEQSVISYLQSVQIAESERQRVWSAAPMDSGRSSCSGRLSGRSRASGSPDHGGVLGIGDQPVEAVAYEDQS